MAAVISHFRIRLESDATSVSVPAGDRPDHINQTLHGCQLVPVCKTVATKLMGHWYGLLDTTRQPYSVRITYCGFYASITRAVFEPR